MTDGVDVVARRLTPDSEWQLPAVKQGLQAMGGVSGIIERANAFIRDDAG